MNELLTSVKNQLILTVMSVLVGLLLGGFLLNRYDLNHLKEESRLTQIKWNVMLQMSSPEAKSKFLEMVNAIDKK